MTRKYFGTDGVRGCANVFPMTPEIAMKIGMAVGLLFSKNDEQSRVVIGKDTRISSYMIENALVAGFTAAGMNVFLIGPVPTPAVAMLSSSMRADVSVMISASHNPFYDNGIKLFGPDGFKLCDQKEKKIEELLQQDLQSMLPKKEKIGRAKRLEGDIYRYIEFAKRTMPRNVSLSGLRIVVDCANGAAYKAAPLALWELGAEVIAIHDQPNGTNINELCGSTQPHSLIEKVIEVRADVGIAFDGDADRLLMVNEKGQIIDGDQLIAVIAKAWHEEKRLIGGGVVTTIMSNLGLERFLQSKNLSLVRTQVGDRYVMEHMRRHNFNVGGEQSGHIILSDYNTTGDGLVAALQVLSYAQKKQAPLSKITQVFQPVPQILKNIQINNKNILKKENVIKKIKEAENDMNGKGRLIVRPSGTEPLIRIMAEGDDEKILTQIVDNVEKILLQNH